MTECPRCGGRLYREATEDVVCMACGFRGFPDEPISLREIEEDMRPGRQGPFLRRRRGPSYGRIRL